jgi:inosine-5'-monophosphate dehydrogenase
MKIIEGLSYDDVLAIPKYSEIKTRKEVSTKTKLTRRISINIPIVSSNMDSVTETKMAIAMAENGGIGIIHRFMPIEKQVAQIKAVKRAESFIIEKPYTLTVNHLLKDAKELMLRHGPAGIIILDENKKTAGILTKRDIIFEKNENRKIIDLMTPFNDLIYADPNIHMDEAVKLLKKHKIEKLPLIDKDRKLKGLITAKDIQKRESHPLASKDKKGRLLVGGAVGVIGDYLERTEALVEAECDVICIDIAHGHSLNCINAIKNIRKEFPKIELIVGNIATKKAAKDLLKYDIDALKVGVGPGCFAAGTRILMANGTYKNIEDIKPGEKVINKEGKPVKVKKAFCTGIRKVSKLRTSLFYEDTYVTPDHNYWVGDPNTTTFKTIQSRVYAKTLNSKTKRKQSKYKWKEISKTQKDVLLMPKKIKFELKNSFKITLMKRAEGTGKNKSDYKPDIVLKPSYELGYIFGMFLGDGNSHTAQLKTKSKIGSVRWYLSKNEKEKINKLSKYIKKIFNKECKITTKNKLVSLILYYKPLADFLQTFGKRKEKHLPSQYLVKNEDYLKGLLDGLIDSDGFTEKQGRINFSNTSKYLIELFNILTYLVKGAFPNNRKKELSTGSLKGTKKENLSQGYVARIIKTFNKRLTKDYQISKILELKETNKYVPVYDLEIDCPTHSFIANNAIVHNSICTTRIVTGCGVPQLTAIMDVAKVSDVPLIADGGIKHSGDILKALAAGAHTVMIGNLLAGTEESPGTSIIREGRKYKLYRGSTSYLGSIDRKERENGYISEEEVSSIVPEGVEGIVPYRGHVKEVLHQLVMGLKSGMSYCGAKTIEELRKKVDFIKISPSGMRESGPHDLTRI